ncbi:hypothetical protein [Nocardia altamirensis]|uniref:hypothetical protein n=1 Tax=Nocardia altamirensis TaxID=472158 RepID=UPI00114CE741|nr:hypothetical protein [Nocardia altamirensis]
MVRKSAVTGFALAALAALLWTAPDASAYVTSVTVSSASSIDLGGGKHGTTCAYTVTVTGSANEYVWLYDSNAATFGTPQFSLGATGTGTSTWTPTATGTHYVQAWSYNGSQWAVIEVGTGVNLGSACVVR